MSYWTYVLGTIQVDACSRSTAETLYKVQMVLNHIPKITGSEGPAEFYPVLPNGHNMRSAYDEFAQLSNLSGPGRYRAFDTQTQCLIVLSATLRDRMFSQTVRETVKSLSRLASRLWIRDCFVRVQSDIGEELILNDPAWLLDADQSGWADKLLWKFDEKGNMI